MGSETNSKETDTSTDTANASMSRRQRRLAEIEQKKKPPRKTLAQAKKEALSLIDEEEKNPDPAALPEEPEPQEPPKKIIHLKPPIIIRELAEQMEIKPFKIIQDLMEMDVFANISQSIEPEVATKICEKHGFEFEKEKREKGAGVHKVEEVIEEPPPPEEIEEEAMQPRAPIITFMGHVDHGKTSLLDTIRKSRVTAGEAGGITQHIGAYSVEKDGQRITFVDTPGHAAFTEMRARGANVTDIVVLVIAADDGIMPQTLEAMNHAKAAGVTIMVAINKVDLPSADVDKVKAQLQEQALTPEDWGGETVCVEVSATEGTGIDKLLEMMALQAEILELKANPGGLARATVIEAKLAPGKGPTATVIVQTGTLKIGTPFICGPYSGKIKSLINDLGENSKEAPPATPVEVLGFDGLPQVGDEIVEMDSERSAKRLSEERLDEIRKEKLSQPKRTTLEGLFESMEEGEKKVLSIILKTDVQGSIEAILGSLQDIKSEKINLNVLHSGAGAISESDVLLASASNAIIIGFNVKVEGKAVQSAKKEGVQIKLYSIIYELIDQVKEAMQGLLEPELRETVIGQATVKQVFKLSKGKVAGCLVTDGRINRTARARVLRGDQPVYDGPIGTLKRFQNEVKEVKASLECGIKLGDFNDYEEKDTIQCYELEKVEQTL